MLTNNRSAVKTLTNFSYIFFFICISILPSNAQGVWDKVTEHPTQEGLYASSGNVVNNKAYIAFGAWISGVVTNNLYEYDPASNTWVQKQSFPGLARYGCATFVVGNIIYYAAGSEGGMPYLNELWAYDTQANTWAQKASIPTATGRIHATGFGVNNKGYVLGGGIDNQANYTSELWEYTPSTDQWALKNSIPVTNPKRVAAVSFVVNNKAYICGGANAGASYLNDTWEYDSILDKWTQKAYRPAGLSSYAAYGFALTDATNNPKGYYVMGANSSPKIFLNSVFEYDLLKDQWKEIADFPGTGRDYGVSFVSQNTAYIGFGSSSYPATSYEKDIWRLSFPVISDTLSISGKIHQGNSMLKNGKVIAHNAANDSTYAVFTDTLGNFFLQPVSSGKYILYALPNAGERYNQTFYPNTSDPYKTDTLILGKSISEIDLYMNPSKTDSDSSESVFNEFNVYPNPFTDHLNITCLKKNTTTGFSKIQIDNVSGGTQQEIFLDKETYSCNIDMQHLSPGFYILKIPTDTGVYMKKIIK